MINWNLFSKFIVWTRHKTEVSLKAMIILMIINVINMMMGLALSYDDRRNIIPHFGKFNNF